MCKSHYLKIISIIPATAEEKNERKNVEEEEKKLVSKALLEAHFM